jgi:hypothetical protein
MKKTHPLLLAGCLVLSASCGGGKSDDSGSSDAKAPENVAEAIDASAKRQAERRAKGDTIAMPYGELQAYLPEVSGFTKDGGPEGSQMNLPGMGSWSQTSQNYSAGDKSIDVTIMDYNGAANAFLGATAMYGMGFSQEDDEKKSQTTDLGIAGVSAFETQYKQSESAELTLVVADRFLIQLRANGTNDLNVLKQAAKSMKLGDLAKR